MNTYYTMHMGRRPTGGFEKTICFRTRKTDSGYVSEPVAVMTSTTQVLDIVSRYVRSFGKD